MTLARARALALALPEATEAPHFDLTSFRVRGKIFATAPLRGGALHIFVTPQQREVALAADAAHLGALTWGGRIVGLQVRLAKAPVGLVRHLLTLAWAARAPKRVVAAHDPGVGTKSGA